MSNRPSHGYNKVNDSVAYDEKRKKIEKLERF